MFSIWTNIGGLLRFCFNHETSEDDDALRVAPARIVYTPLSLRVIPPADVSKRQA